MISCFYGNLFTLLLFLLYDAVNLISRYFLRCPVSVTPLRHHALIIADGLAKGLVCVFAAIYLLKLELNGESRRELYNI